MGYPLVSICIPVFKKEDFVLRCLHSINKQDYKNIEVIISDDSPDESIKEIVKQFPNLAIHYFHNPISLKSPANWNAAINRASGELFMLLHQDDWLQMPTSISSFVTCFSNAHVGFAFCKNIGLDSSNKWVSFQIADKILDLKKRVHILICRNLIGPPSNVMLRKNIPVRYDEILVWLVDIDYYMRLLQAGFSYCYLKQHLVTIGIHGEQTTEIVRANKALMFKENIVVAKKLHDAAFNDIILYDYYWRLIRNSNMQQFDQGNASGILENGIPRVLVLMIDLQKKISTRLLKIGIFSKAVMLFSYLKWRFK